MKIPNKLEDMYSIIFNCKCYCLNKKTLYPHLMCKCEVNKNIVEKETKRLKKLLGVKNAK